MVTVGLAEAREAFEDLVGKARAGETVIITSGLDQTPVVQLGPVEPVKKKKRLGARETPGFALGEAFWEPLPDEELRLWNGEGD